MPDPAPPKGQTAMTSMAGEITKKAYDKETFAALMECVSRLFFCDEEIVIIDLLLATERAISEKDLEEELGMADYRLREHLARLERHRILKSFSNTVSTNIYQKTQRPYKKDATREGTSTHSFWRINNHVILAIHYKLAKMEEVLQQRLKGLYECDNFVCPKCEATYDSLTVQTLEIDGFDAHFICKCGTKVELDDKSTKEDVYSSQQKRFEEQVKTLKKCLFNAWGMEVPEFPLFSRKPEKQEERSGAESSAANDASSATGAASSVVSEDSETPVKSTVHSLSDPGRLDLASLVGRTDNRKIKFHMKVSHHDSTQSPGSQASRAPKQEELPREDRAPAQQRPLQEPDEIPDFYIASLNRSVSLMEAQQYQQHMTNAEFENFVELQDKYLNII